MHVGQIAGVAGTTVLFAVGGFARQVLIGRSGVPVGTVRRIYVAVALGLALICWALAVLFYLGVAPAATPHDGVIIGSIFSVFGLGMVGIAVMDALSKNDPYAQYRKKPPE